jgi:hypothetical protein
MIMTTIKCDPRIHFGNRGVNQADCINSMTTFVRSCFLQLSPGGLQLERAACILGWSGTAPAITTTPSNNIAAKTVFAFIIQTPICI